MTWIPPGDQMTHYSRINPLQSTRRKSHQPFTPYNQTLNHITFSPARPVYIKPLLATLIYLFFHPLEVVSRYRDPQPQVVENYSYLFNLRPNIYKSYCLNSYFIHNICDLIDSKTTIIVISRQRVRVSR